MIYIGSTNDLIRRLSEHNSGFGSNQTAPPSLRPWALLAYVTGFDGDKRARLNFENRWIQAKEEYISDLNYVHTVEGILMLATDLIPLFMPLYKLRLVKCGTLDHPRERT